MRSISISLLLLLCFSIHQLHVSAQTYSNTQDSLAKVYYQNFQFQAVIDLLNDDSLSQAQIELRAKAYEKMGNWEQAIAHYQLALNQKPQNKQHILALANCYEKIDEFQAAISQLNQLVKMDTNNAYFYRLLGNVHLKSQSYLYALSNYNKACELNPNDLISGLALTRLQLQLDFKERALEMANELLKHHAQNKAVLQAHMKAAYKNKEYEACTRAAETLFSLNDSNLLVQKIAGIAYFHQQKYPQAIDLLEKVIEVDKESDILYYYLGISYRETKQNEKAQKALERSIDYAISDNLESYYTQLAVSYEEAGNHVKAIHYYQAAYKSSRDKILLYHLARNYDTYYQDKSTALEYYERYLESEDTANQLYQNYSKHRINELKVSKHFELDTVN